MFWGQVEEAGLCCASGGVRKQGLTCDCLNDSYLEDGKPTYTV